MQKNPLKDLIQKYQEKQCTPEEIALLESWYLQWNEKNREDLPEAQLITARQRLWDELEPKVKPAPGWRLWWSIGSAAVILILGWAGLYFYPNKSAKNVSAQIVSATDIGPGKNTATLTLANGRRIVLSDAVKGELVKEAGVTITKTKDGQVVYTSKTSLSEGTEELKYNTLSTEKGEQYQMILPDGTRVWLNAASALKFPSTFNGLTTRTVELSGEAYFEVAKDKAHPFKVKTTGQEVEVLGTHFNINSYADLSVVKTTLLEGSVKVSPFGYVNGKEGIMAQYAVTLKPGEQAEQKEGSIAVTTGDAEQSVAWKNGWFSFKSTSLQGVLYEASKWYDLEVIYGSHVPADHFTGKVPRSASLAKFIKVLQLSDVKFRIEGRKIFVN